MQAIVLAGGKGKRLWPLTSKIPKPLVSILQKPILRYHLEWLYSEGVREVVVACGYMSDSIIEYLEKNPIKNLSVKFSIESKPLGRAGATKQAVNLLSRPEKVVIVSHVDIISNISLGQALQLQRRLDSMLTLILVPYRSSFGIVEVDERDLVKDFQEKPILPYWVNSGIYVAHPDFFIKLPGKGDEEMTIRKLLKERCVSGFCDSEHYWRAIDTQKDLIEVENDIKHHAYFPSFL